MNLKQIKYTESIPCMDTAINSFQFHLAEFALEQKHSQSG